MRIHLLAHAEQPAVLAVRHQVGHDLWRRRRRRSEQVLQNPFASLDYRRSVRVRGYGQNATLPKQPSPHGSVLLGKRYSAELRAVDARDAVMFGQPLVEESIVGVKQVEDAA